MARGFQPEPAFASGCLAILAALEPGGGIGRVGRFRKLAAKFLQQRGGASDNAGSRSQAFDRLDLLDDVELVLRKLSGQLRQLRADQRADTGDREKRQQYDANHRGDGAEVKPPQSIDQRPKRERQQDRERQGG